MQNCSVLLCVSLGLSALTFAEVHSCCYWLTNVCRESETDRDQFKSRHLSLNYLLEIRQGANIKRLCRTVDHTCLIEASSVR